MIQMNIYSENVDVVTQHCIAVATISSDVIRAIPYTQITIYKYIYAHMSGI